MINLIQMVCVRRGLNDKTVMSRTLTLTVTGVTAIILIIRTPHLPLILEHNSSLKRINLTWGNLNQIGYQETINATQKTNATEINEQL